VLLGFSQAWASTRNPEDDLKALDMADAEVSDNLPAQHNAALTKPKVHKIPKVTKKAKIHKKVAAALKKQVPDPEATAKTSALWNHENELTAQDDADKILEEGDAEASKKIEEIHEQEEAKVAPARVHRVSDEEAAAAKSDKSDALEAVKNVVQDIKDAKEAKTEEAKRKAEVEKEEKEEADEKKKNAAKKNVTKASKPALPVKKINLDKLMNLAKAAKANALGSPKTQFMQDVGNNTAPTQGIAAKAFQGPSTKAEVKNNTRSLHSKMAQHIASMHTALHENVKSQEEAKQYEQNKAIAAAKDAAAAAKAKADAEAERKRQQSTKYQAALKTSADTAKVEAEQRALAKAKVRDYRAAQRKLREAKPEPEPVLVKPEVVVQNIADIRNSPGSKSGSWTSGLAFATLAVVAAGC